MPEIFFPPWGCSLATPMLSQLKSGFRLYFGILQLAVPANKICITCEVTNEWASKPHRCNGSLRRKVSLWPWSLTSDLENLFDNGQSHDDYYTQLVLLKALSTKYKDIGWRKKNLHFAATLTFDLWPWKHPCNSKMLSKDARYSITFSRHLTEQQPSAPRNNFPIRNMCRLGVVVSVVGCINEVNQHRARLVHDGWPLSG